MKEKNRIKVLDSILLKCHSVPASVVMGSKEMKRSLYLFLSVLWREHRKMVVRLLLEMEEKGGKEKSAMVCAKRKISTAVTNYD